MRIIGEATAAEQVTGHGAASSGLDDVEVGQRVAPGLEGAVDDVHEHRAALDVTQELQAQAPAFRTPRGSAGNVGHREPDVTGGDDPSWARAS